MKKEIPENEKLISKKQMEGLESAFMAPFIELEKKGIKRREINRRLDQEEYPDFLQYFINGGIDLCKEQQYSLPDVLQITNLNKAKFLQWLNKEQITLFSATKQGSGKHLKYSILDLQIIFLAMSLVNIRVPIPLAEQIKYAVLTRLKDVVERKQEIGIYRIQLNFLPGLQKWKATQSITETSPDEEDKNMSSFIVVNVDRLIYDCLCGISYFNHEKEIQVTTS